MPHGDYIPNREGDLLSWSSNLANILLASPNYGLTAQQVADYCQLQLAFANALAVARNPMTQGRRSVMAKNDRKRALIDTTRKLVAVMQAWPEMTDQKRLALGIPMRDRASTPVHAPSEHPELDVLAVMGRTIKIRLRPPCGQGRGRPAGILGATVFYAVGQGYPQATEAWHFVGNVSATTFNMSIPAKVAGGSRVWLMAAWVNAKLQSGPTCPPVHTHIAEGMVRAA